MEHENLCSSEHAWKEGTEGTAKAHMYVTSLWSCSMNSQYARVRTRSIVTSHVLSSLC